MRCKTLAMVLLVACKAKGESKLDEAVTYRQEAQMKLSEAAGSASGGEAESVADLKVAKLPAAAPAVEEKPAEPKLAMKEDMDGELDQTRTQTSANERAKGTGKDRAANRPEGPTRAWFPETFLFQPLVVTDEHGAAQVAVRVPDRLTTWRVLALAHSRTGAQGGAVTSFLGTLPTYVDPVVPKFLVAGDEVRLPIQLVNTTDQAVRDTFSIDATNAALRASAGARQIPALGNLVEYATLRADKPGDVTVHAALGETDAVVRTFPVLPQGRPVSVVHGGTLAAPRSLELAGPAGANPATDRVRLSIVPGALALLRAELAASGGRAGVADDAYALLIAGRAPALLARLGDTPDVEALHDLAVLATQRAMRDGRTLDVTSAALLAEAALAHGQNAVLARLGERAVAYLAQNQRPDGTFGGETGWTLARLLVTTAEATRAVMADTSTPAARQRALQVQARAASAFERNAAQVDDGYTAAAILASGAVSGPAADALRGKVKTAIKKSDDGAAFLAIDEGAQRADGARPGSVEGTALAILALDGDASAKALRADLGTTVLAAYSPGAGWGDGRTNLACMQAMLALFRDPLPDTVKITLTMDGKPVTEGVLDRAKLRDVAVLAAAAPAPGLAGKHTWRVEAEPAVPGLGYSLALDAWVPWEQQPAHDGLELSVPATIRGTVGAPVEVAISAIAPSGVPVHVEQSLPAGVQVDTPALEAMVSEGKLTRFEVSEGKVEMEVAPLAPGQVFAAKLRLIPTLAGTLHSSASKISIDGHESFVPPSTWLVQ